MIALCSAGRSAIPSPDQQQFDAVRQSIDQITSNMATNQEQITRSIDRIAARVAASQEQLTRSVDQLAVSQEWLTREITKLEEIEQSIRYRKLGAFAAFATASLRLYAQAGAAACLHLRLGSQTRAAARGDT